MHSAIEFICFFALLANAALCFASHDRASHAHHRDLGAGGKSRPNFVFIQTDDQARWDMIAMNKTVRLIADQGASFANYMVNTPICCPSRTEIFSGRYYHNVGAPNGSCMHVNSEYWVFDKTSLFSTLQSGGYLTGVFGKVTNDQGGYFCKKMMADGMTMVSSPCDYNDFYSKKYFVKLANGTKYVETLDGSLPTTYQTSQIGNRSISWIKEVATSNAGTPFFAYLGPHAPHYPADPAPWQTENIFADVKAPRTPSWNASSPDKHEMVADNPPMNDNSTLFSDHQHQIRLLSLLSVDDVIEAVYNTLQELNILDNTYIIFTSDHGYHLGQWRIPSSKQQPYDTDIFVTTLMRGPGIGAGTTVKSMVGNVDITPTILDLAGVEKPEAMDGKSMAKLVVTEDNRFYDVREEDAQQAAENWRDTYLIEYKSVGKYDNTHAVMWWPGKDFHGQHIHPPAAPCKKGCPDWWLDGPSNTYRGIRIQNSTHNLFYGEFNPDWQFSNETDVFHEYYNINEDPDQLSNVYKSTAGDILKDLHNQLETYSTCWGGSCP